MSAATMHETTRHPVLRELRSMLDGLTTAPTLPASLQATAYPGEISVHVFADSGDDLARIASVWALAVWLGDEPRVVADLHEGSCQYNVYARRDGLTVNVVTILAKPAGGER